MDEETEGEKQRTQDCKKCHSWTFSLKPLYSNNNKRLTKETEGEKWRTQKTVRRQKVKNGEHKRL